MSPLWQQFPLLAIAILLIIFISNEVFVQGGELNTDTGNTDSESFKSFSETLDTFKTLGSLSETASDTLGTLSDTMTDSAKGAEYLVTALWNAADSCLTSISLDSFVDTISSLFPCFGDGAGGGDGGGGGGIIDGAGDLVSNIGGAIFGDGSGGSGGGGGTGFSGASFMNQPVEYAFTWGRRGPAITPYLVPQNWQEALIDSALGLDYWSVMFNQYDDRPADRRQHYSHYYGYNSGGGTSSSGPAPKKQQAQQSQMGPGGNKQEFQQQSHPQATRPADSGKVMGTPVQPADGTPIFARPVPYQDLFKFSFQEYLDEAKASNVHIHNVYPLAMTQIHRHLTQEEMERRIRWSLAERPELLACASSTYNPDRDSCQRERAIRGVLQRYGQYLLGANEEISRLRMLQSALKWAVEKCPADDIIAIVLELFVPMSNVEKQALMPDTGGRKQYFKHFEAKMKLSEMKLDSQGSRLLDAIVTSSSRNELFVIKEEFLAEHARMIVAKRASSSNSEATYEFENLLVKKNFDHLRAAFANVPIKEIGEFDYKKLEEILVMKDFANFQKLFAALSMDIIYGRPHLIVILIKYYFFKISENCRRGPSAYSTTITDACHNALASLWRILVTRASVDLVDIDDMAPTALENGLNSLQEPLLAEAKGRVQQMVNFLHELLYIVKEAKYGK